MVQLLLQRLKTQTAYINVPKMVSPHPPSPSYARPEIILTCPPNALTSCLCLVQEEEYQRWLEHRKMCSRAYKRQRRAQLSARKRRVEREKGDRDGPRSLSPLHERGRHTAPGGGRGIHKAHEAICVGVLACLYHLRSSACMCMSCSHGPPVPLL